MPIDFYGNWGHFFRVDNDCRYGQADESCENTNSIKHMKKKCIVILSEKSSGSSICQNILRDKVGVRTLPKTRHFENETLFWVKVAAALGYEQASMIYSEVPFTQAEGKRELERLIVDNLSGFKVPISRKEDAFLVWNNFCTEYGPIFLEKSPHHLCQKEALKLLVECAENSKDIDFFFIGLVRNPLDTIYSQYNRWGWSPKKIDEQWRLSYQNLLWLRDVLKPNAVSIVRYEDIVRDAATLQPVLDFCQFAGVIGEDSFYRESVSKWKQDPFFGHVLASDTRRVASDLGYSFSELEGRSIRLFFLFRKLKRLNFFVREFLRRIKRLVNGV